MIIFQKTLTLIAFIVIINLTRFNMKQEQYIPFDWEFIPEQQITEYTVDKKEVQSFTKLFNMSEYYFQYSGSYPFRLFFYWNR
jgi:hypothetical protein